jgi:fatty-acyl-CoA synthase
VRGLMQNDQLILTRILERAASLAPHRPILTRTESGLHRQTYEELGERTARLASGLGSLGVRPGDRVGSFAWNSFRHLELYFAVPCMGAVLHTLNIRLHPDQVAWIANHAGDRVIVLDDSLVPVFERIAHKLTSVEHLVVMGDGDRGSLDRVIDYEELLAGAPSPGGWPELDENDACNLCYTSGTTGRPRGVLYSHRSMVLHALMVNQAETIGLTSHDTVLPVVPMFHANAWGLPHAATLAGAAQVFTGSFGADAHVLGELIERERVTVTGGVPTVWIGLLHHLEDHPHDLSSLRKIKGGGAAIPTSLVEQFWRRHGVRIQQGWGMTETGPLASIAASTPETESLPQDEQFRVLARQGRVVPGIRFRVVDDEENDVPWDDATMGEIRVKGNWVASAYFNDDGDGRTADSFTEDGWLRTGDIAVVDERGYLQLKDRAGDLVKSGGEWISTVELESALMGHPAVLEAAVIAVPHERWQERPLACVVLRPGAAATREELLAFIAPRFASWWLPDDVVFVDEIPKTSVGKFDKRTLRREVAEGTDGA